MNYNPQIPRIAFIPTANTMIPQMHSIQKNPSKNNLFLKLYYIVYPPPFPMQMGPSMLQSQIPLTMPTARMPMIMNVPLNPMMAPSIQKPLYESKKVWVGKIPEGVSDTFMLKLLETCGTVISWKRMTDPRGKLNSFGICEYLTVESMLKSLRLLNNFPLDNSELQVKVGSETEEFLKKWRERKKMEWIDSLRIKGVEVDLQEIKRKEESGEPLEWELQLVSKDQDTLKVIYDVLAQRQEIEVYAKQAEKPELFLKDLKELASGSLSTHFESDRERERQRKKNEKLKKLEKAFRDEERRWLRHEEDVEREKSQMKHEKEYIQHKKQKLLEKDLNYDSEKEKEKIAQNPKKYEEHRQNRIKEKEYDDYIRKKENGLLFRDEELKNHVTSTALATIPKEPEAKTKIVVQEYKPENEEQEEPKTKLEIVELDIKQQKLPNVQIAKIDEEDNDDPYTKKRKLSNIAINPETEKELLQMSKTISYKKENNATQSEEIYNIDDLIKQITPEKYIDIQKSIIALIPQNKDDLLKYKINWNIVNNYKIKRNKLKPWLDKKLIEYFDDVDSFTKLILDKIGKNNPYEILDTIKKVLEEDAEVIFNILFIIFI